MTVGIKASADIEGGLRVIGLLALFVAYPVILGYYSWGHWKMFAAVEALPMLLAVFMVIPKEWLERMIGAR